MIVGSPKKLTYHLYQIRLFFCYSGLLCVCIGGIFRSEPAGGQFIVHYIPDLLELPNALLERITIVKREIK